MEVISKIILGIVQGITEIIPVSSSGHLILLNELTGVEIDLAFLTFLHFSTGLAIILGFWDEIKYILRSKMRSHLFKIIIVASIPAILVGIFTYSFVETFLHNVFVVIPSLIIFGFLMILVDIFFSDKVQIKKFEEIKKKNAIIIGLAQILAIIPGTSRSGITIMPAVMMGIDKKIAVAFSFLIGLPLIIGGFFFEIFKTQTSINAILKQENIIGGLTAFIFAYFAILIFKKLARTKFLMFFGLYRIALGIVMAIILLAI